MRILVVGGTGMIGGYIALRLREQGHDVAIAARNPPVAGSALAGIDFILGSYADGDFTNGQLADFDALVFTAGNDLRHLPPGLDEAGENAFYRRLNTEATPRFFALAREAGVSRAALVGTFYAHTMPELIGSAGYVRSRLDADEGVRALAGPDFHVVTLNPPMVIGMLPNDPPALERMRAQWALGRLDFPLHATSGGANFMSAHSLYEAVLGGLMRGENGCAYLVGDQNLHYAEFFALYFEAAGRPAMFEIRDQEMPAMADPLLYAGREGTIFYEPEGVETLGYRRNDIARTVREIVECVRLESMDQ